MALTRRMLKAMGIEDEKIDEIIAAHSETVDGLKDQLKAAKDGGEDVEQLKAELKKAKDDLAEATKDDWQQKYNDEHKAFSDYKAAADKAKADAEKKTLCRQMLVDAGVAEKYVDTVLRVYDQSNVIVENGAIKERDSLIDGIKKDWSEFIGKVGTKGADVQTPPGKDNGGDVSLRAKNFMAERNARMYGNAIPNDESK